MIPQAVVSPAAFRKIPLAGGFVGVEHRLAVGLLTFRRLKRMPDGPHGRLFLSAYTSGLASATEGRKYRADEWIAESDPSPSTGAADCSISGSFALVVMLQTGNIGGQPFPVRAVAAQIRGPQHGLLRNALGADGVRRVEIARQIRIGRASVYRVFAA
jgi:hypothetical protein